MHSSMQAKELLIRMARHVTEVQRQHGIMVDNLEEQCNFGLMEVIHEWASGVVGGGWVLLVGLWRFRNGMVFGCFGGGIWWFQRILAVSESGW